jgi:hypothetical protein
MTEGAALHFPYHGCFSAVIIFLAAYSAVQVLHQRRLRRFGNPQLLGLTGLWPRRICSGIFLAATVGALVALHAGPGARSGMPGAKPGLVVFLIDPPGRPPGISYIEAPWREYGRELRLVVESIRPERVAVYVCGSPPRMVVPATEDVPGALLLLDAGSADYEVPTAGSVETSVRAIRLIASRADAEAPCAVVAVSPRAESEIDAVANSSWGEPPVIFIQSTLGKGTPGYRSEGPRAQWMRLELPESLRAFVRSLLQREGQPGWPDGQVLALIAFLALYLESVLRLLWSAAAASGRRIFPHAVPRDTAAQERPVPGLSTPLLLVMICLASGNAAGAPSADPGGAAHRILIEGITPHVAVVTEVSDEEPYVGQQFSVIYKLRCSIPPTAVDVDPQDFTGFWTVTAPTSGQARPEPVTLNGRAATDFLLRQLIVFPLRPGRQALPALRLKMKQGSSSLDDWDLTTHTRPFEVDVRPVPATQEGRDTFSLVGSLEAKLSDGEPDKADEAILEIQGTANLAFFRPENWLKNGDGKPLLIRLRDAETLVQTRDYEGKRRLTFLQRRKWTVGVLSGERTGIGLKPFSIPFFDPEASTWRTQEIPAFVPGSNVRASRARAAIDTETVELRPSHAHAPRYSTPVIIAFTVSCMSLLVVMIAGRSSGRTSPKRAASAPAPRSHKAADETPH